MNPRELVDHIRSGPAKLVLEEPLRFRRRTRSNPCDFNEFLQALRSSETISTAECGSHRPLGVTEDEWVLLIKTLGNIKDIHHLDFACTPGSRYFYPLQAVADAVKSAHSLYKLEIDIVGETLPRDPSGMIALANALREHTALQEFACFDWSLLLAAQDATTDFVLQALSACPHLRKVTIMTKRTSGGAMKYLLQLHKATYLRLVLKADHWLVVADEIRRGCCNVQTLTLAMAEATGSQAMEAVQAVASAIQLDCNLKHLSLEVGNGFSDEVGVSLVEALTVNKNCTRSPFPLIIPPIRRIKLPWVPPPMRPLVQCCAPIPVSFCSFLYPRPLPAATKDLLILTTRWLLSND
jgi:hypothetical protein